MGLFERKLFRAVITFLGFLVAPFALWAAGSTTVVISQLYTAGGNSGATYNADYIEIFNLSSANVSLSGYALQYMSTSGTTSTVITLPSGITLAPGQRYLVQGTPSTTNGAALPVTADTTQSGLAMGASAGRIYLTSSTTALTGSCPTGGAIVDFVGWGTTTCFEGTKASPTPTTTLASLRNNSCIDTDDNGADFSTGTPAPRNSSSTPTPCSGSTTPTSPSLNASANPSSVNAGLSTLLTAVVTAGSSPASTGITVTANVAAFGGSTTQPLYDDGTHGDAKAGDGTYSYSLSVPSGQGAGQYAINFSVSDSQLRTGTGSTNVTVLAAAGLIPIHTIQGSTSTYSGQMVTVSGIITGIRTNGFYLQARDSAADSDPNTSEAIFIHTSTGAVPGTAVIGTEMEVTGTVALYPSTSVLPGTEIDSPTGYTVLSTAQGLPAAITLTTTNPSPGGGINQLQRYQSMRVAVPSFTSTQGTGGTFVESTETYTSDGTFWGTVTGVARPVREPGLEVLDPFTAGQPSTIARFDDNPEVFEVDSASMVGSPAPIDLTSNTVLTNMTGIMDFAGGSPLFVIDGANRPTVSGGMTGIAPPAPASNELTLGDLNMERFYNATKDTAGAVVITQDAYTRRLKKASLAIRNLLLSPDILALEEMENLATLTDLSNQISADALAAGQADPQYSPYLVVGNDSSGISVGFLVKTSRVTVNDVSQIGKTTTYTQPSTGSQATLNDRPPLVLHAGIKRSGASDYPLTVIVNHLRSLNNVTDSTGTGQNVRAKREQQAEFLANLIQGYQKAGEHVISVGDYNAFEFNDGLVDSLNIIRGIVTPANQDVLAGPATALVTPALVDVAPTNLAKGDYSYTYVGNAQSIDHFLVTSDIAGTVHTSAIHLNADFPVTYRNDATRPERTSDHDGILGYIAIPGISIKLSPTSLDFGTQVAKTTTSLPVTVSNVGNAAVSISNIAASGTGYSQTNNCGTSLAAGKSCTVTVSFTPTAAGTVAGTLTLTDSDITGTQSVPLTGTGAGVSSTTTLSASSSNVVSGSSVTFTATVTGNSTPALTGTVTFYDGSTSLGSSTVTSGKATFSTSALTVTTHSITATYSGDTTYPSSTSSAVSVTVTAPPVPDFTFSIANSQVIVTAAAPVATTTINVAMVNGFSQTVSFACTSVPANTTCAFSPATLSASGASTLTITSHPASASAAPGPAVNGRSGAILAFALLGLPMLLPGVRRRFRGSALLGAALVLLTLGFAAGCGNGVVATAKGTSAVTVTATAGTTTHTASFSLVVQ